MISKLITEIQKKNAPIVVGLDPQLGFLPKKLMKDGIKEYGESLEAVAAAVFEFNKAIIDATYDLIPAVKPQIAMYEQFGVSGLVAFRETVEYAKSKGLIVIGDIKRGDIGSTSGAYALGHIGTVQVGSTDFCPFDEDMVTVNPYLGSDGVKPFIDVCNKNDRGIFVLVKTSNPSSGEFQDREVDGRPLYELVGEKVAEWGQDSMDGEYSNVGAVVGATYPEQGRILRKLMPKTYILVPGYGAQGGQGKDLVDFFNEDGLGAIINSSRGIIAAHTKSEYAKFGEAHFAEASRQAVVDMLDDIRGALGTK
jgi:orotidine-5'-phosphate decarboxylase